MLSFDHANRTLNGTNAPQNGSRREELSESATQRRGQRLRAQNLCSLAFVMKPRHRGANLPATNSEYEVTRLIPNCHVFVTIEETNCRQRCQTLRANVSSLDKTFGMFG
jgi:hypothetical protein